MSVMPRSRVSYCLSESSVCFAPDKIKNSYYLCFNFKVAY